MGISIYTNSIALIALPVYRVNWLRAKAAKDRWTEELELVEAEFQWTVNFFQTKAGSWEALRNSSEEEGRAGGVCYAARQTAMYARLRDQCKTAWEEVSKSSPTVHLL